MRLDEVVAGLLPIALALVVDHVHQPVHVSTDFDRSIESDVRAWLGGAFVDEGGAEGPGRMERFG